MGMRYSRSKWWKYVHLTKHPELLPTLPDTRTLSRTRFGDFLDRYGEVIVKPTGGWGGAGVKSVSAVGGERYEVHSGKKRRTIRGLSSTYAYVRGGTSGRKLIVQRKIPLARVNGRPFDVRVMVQRKPGKDWTVTGKLAKIAGAGYIVTNVARSGGKVVSLSAAVRDSNISPAAREGLEQRIDRIALQAASQLRKYYRIDTVGLDIGIDAAGKIWIIEPNFTPSVSLFAKLKDKSAYRKILSFRKA